ncbi:hypothetical protein PLICRDRAFT_47104 [Plicaturopsis crispa FD-325 SS-3]|uniref:PAN2-PAN3 deadenylation complex subunit PAN3 n=1 Tax=Plicaturopsis crispa FD-325 SS-3 TaxID=944288 RepID=A0A0C9SQD5_PLICR|nr:hypothetical protein PLICRDRAFT_47104 [Plicaturopsis crispa FD-325 SS-3]
MSFFARPQGTSAVKIVRPEPEEETLPKESPRKENQRQCRNILIYGSCKFQDKGCIYYHPPAQDDTIPTTDTTSPRMSNSTPVKLSAAVNAPVFVPKSAVAAAFSPPSTPPPPSAASTPSVQAYNDQDQEHDPYNPYSYPASHDDELNGHAGGIDPYEASPDMYSSGYDASNGMDPFYQTPQPTFVRQPLLYHLYTAPIPAPFDSHFLPSDLRESLTQRAETLRTYPASTLAGLPDELQGYHTLVPLENTSNERRKFGNWYSVVYRATSSVDGGTYALRRVENFRLMHQAAFTAIETWSRIQHPNIVSVREAFTTRAFNDNSLVVAYTYHANSLTLFDAHLSSTAGHKQPSPLPERTLWSYLIQLASAVKAVHDAGLAVRVIDCTKIIVTSKNRVRIGSCGLVDVLTYIPNLSPDPALIQHQQDDIICLGRVIMALATLNLAAPSNLPKALDTMNRLYSAELKNVVLWMIGVTKTGVQRTIAQVFELIGSRVALEMDEANNAVDKLEGELMSELENARLVRLLCKFGFINERPEFSREPRWSETGDRYIIKLFRDYVFHQVDEAGNPVVNLSHVLTCLNKLDVGTEERIMLVARDEQSCLVVSYKEVKSCIDAAFSDLARTSYTQ